MASLLLELMSSDSKVSDLAIAGSCFEDEFNHKPVFYVRVPGRVNLIGEHIDYCGYAVFPMAIEQDIVLGVGPNSNQKLNLTNIKHDSYENVSADVESLKIDSSELKWFHYFFCGVKGVIDENKLLNPVGIDVSVHGTIPPSAGLSSSSALVCAAALAFAHANE